jgi:hypothetical protein
VSNALTYISLFVLGLTSTHSGKQVKHGVIVFGVRKCDHHDQQLPSAEERISSEAISRSPSSNLSSTCRDGAFIIVRFLPAILHLLSSPILLIHLRSPWSMHWLHQQHSLSVACLATLPFVSMTCVLILCLFVSYVHVASC